MNVLKFIGSCNKEIGFILIGFYIMGLILAFSIMSQKSYIDVINTLGLFLSSAGVIAVILSIIQQAHFKEQEKIDKTFQASNLLQLQLCNMIDRYNDIRHAFNNAYVTKNIKPYLLDGHGSDYINQFDFSVVSFIAEHDPELVINVYYAVLNYKRFIDGIFRWQECQESDPDLENIKNYNDRINQLKEFAKTLIILHKKLDAILVNKYPDKNFIAYNPPDNTFDELNLIPNNHGD